MAGGTIGLYDASGVLVLRLPSALAAVASC